MFGVVRSSIAFWKHWRHDSKFLIAFEMYWNTSDVDGHPSCRFQPSAQVNNLHPELCFSKGYIRNFFQLACSANNQVLIVYLTGRAKVFPLVYVNVTGIRASTLVFVYVTGRTRAFPLVLVLGLKACDCTSDAFAHAVFLCVHTVHALIDDRGSQLAKPSASKDTTRASMLQPSHTQRPSTSHQASASTILPLWSSK